MPRADRSTLPTGSCYITVSQSPPRLCHLICAVQEELYTLDSLTSSSLRLATLPCMKYKMVWLIQLWSHTCFSPNRQMPTSEVNPVFQGKQLRDLFPNFSYIQEKWLHNNTILPHSAVDSLHASWIWGPGGKCCWHPLHRAASSQRLKCPHAGGPRESWVTQSIKILLSPYTAAQTLPGQWAMLPGRTHAQVSTGGFLPHHRF